MQHLKYLKSFLKVITVFFCFLAQNFCFAANEKEQPPVILISYAAGDPIHFLNQQDLVKSAENKGIDKIHKYSFEDLDESFRNRHQTILEQKRGAGYWLWKPWIIYNEMKKQPEDAIIVYVDSGVNINAHLQPLIDLTRKKGFVLFKNTHRNSPYVKKDCFILMNCDEPYYHNAMQYQASMVFIRNDLDNRIFINKWLNYCQDPKILTDQKNELGENPPEFKDHRHDQAILSLLYLKENKTGVVLSINQKRKYFVHHRRRKLEKLL